MSKQTKLKSFSALKIAGKNHSELWNKFLQEKGHSYQTYSYLPESIKLSLRLSFAKKNN